MYKDGRYGEVGCNIVFFFCQGVTFFPNRNKDQQCAVHIKFGNLLQSIIAVRQSLINGPMLRLFSIGSWDKF